MSYSKKASVSALLFFITVSSFSQNDGEKLYSFLSSYAAIGQFNGSALVIEKGKVLLKKSYGLANFTWQIPNTTETKFRIGSISKAFTAMIILKLAEQGKLKPDDKVLSYIPDFNKLSLDKITIAHLLTHTSGLPDYNNVPEFFRMVQSGNLSDAEIVKKIASYELLFEPGTKFSYSNDGYRLLGAVIEKVTSKRYSEVLDSLILKPLSLQNTGYMSRTAIVSELASGYQKRITGLENAPFYEPSPASGMYSTITDLYKWLQAVKSNKALSQSDKELIWKISPFGNAYGWQVSALNINNKTVQRIMTEGTVYGFFARLVYLPEENITIALLTNIRGAKNYLPDIEKGVIQILSGQSYELPKKSIADTLYKVINEKNAAAAVLKYRELKKKEMKHFNFDESELNSLGYQLLNSKKLQDAIAIFRLNTEMFPNSSNVYDSLGEAFMLAGSKTEAILNYQKSLDLDPSNINAKQMIQKLSGN